MQLPFNLDQIAAFALVLVRVTCFLLVAPFFTARNVPQMFKIGLAVFFSLMIYTASPSMVIEGISGAPGSLIILALKEVLTGLLLGYTVTAIFLTVQAAGQLIDMQMGLSMVNILDPQFGIQTPLLGNLLNLFALLLFIGLDGPFTLITALIQSYSFIPIGHYVLNGAVFEVVVRTVSAMCLLALKLSMPVLAALFLTDAAFAILARTVPQMNIFVVGAPLKIAVGFLALLLIMPAVVYMFENLFHYGFSAMDALLHVLGGKV